MSEKSNHSDFLREQENKKNQTLQELQELRNLLGKDTSSIPYNNTPEEPHIPAPNPKPQPSPESSLDDTQTLSRAASNKNPSGQSPSDDDTVLIENNIYEQAVAEQKRQEDLERQERIRRTSPQKPPVHHSAPASTPHKKPSSSVHKQAAHKQTEPKQPAHKPADPNKPRHKVSRAEAARRKKAKAQRRIILTAVIAAVLVIIFASAIRTVFTAKAPEKVSAESGSGKTMTSAPKSNVVVTETGKKIKWDDSKPASEQITEQYLAIKDNPDAADYQKLYPGMYSDSRSVPTEESDKKVCYLTFDDGPSETVTPKILDTLEKYDVNATFFLVTSQIKGNEELIKRMVKDGDTICIHANVHEYDTIYASVESYLKDFAQAYDTIYETTGYRVQGFRFPGGSNNGIITSDDALYQAITSEMIRRGFEYYDWNAYDGDAEGSIPEPSSLASRAIEEVNESSRNDAIVLMHDTYGKENTAAALPSIIEGLHDDGIDILPIKSSTRPVHFAVNDSTPSEYSLEAEEETPSDTATSESD